LYLTKKQLEYILKNAKSEYYNSLDLNNKIGFAGTFKDQEKLFKLAENPNLHDGNVRSLLNKATDKDKMAQIIIENKPKLSDDNFFNLLYSATDKDKIAQLIIKYKPELTNHDVKNLLNKATDKDKMAELIINKKPELSDNNVYFLLQYATDIDKIAQILGSNNINKLTDEDVSGFFDDIPLLHVTTDKPKFAQIINKYHTKKTPEIQKILDKYLNEI